MTSKSLRAAAALLSIGLASCSSGGPTPSTLRGGITPQTHVAGDHLKCFSVPNGACSTSENVATLSIANDSAYTAGVSNAGVTIAGAKAIKGLTVSQLTNLSFDFTGPVTVGGDPRFNIPIAGGVIFIAGNACFTPNGSNGYTLDAINNPACAVQTSTSSAYYPNWAAFVAANPNLIVTDAAYILIDEPGTWTIQNVNVQ